MGCLNLKNISVDRKNKAYSDIDGVLFDKKKTELILYPSGKEQSDYVIPDIVTEIKNGAFIGCKAGITLPKSISKIEEFIFSECKEIISVTIPNSVTEVKYSAFYKCENLKTANIYADKDSIIIDKAAFPEHTAIKFISDIEL
jgi:hypothetical protein